MKTSSKTLSPFTTFKVELYKKLLKLTPDKRALGLYKLRIMGALTFQRIQDLIWELEDDNIISSSTGSRLILELIQEDEKKKKQLQLNA